LRGAKPLIRGGRSKCARPQGLRPRAPGGAKNSGFGGGGWPRSGWPPPSKPQEGERSAWREQRVGSSVGRLEACRKSADARAHERQGHRRARRGSGGDSGRAPLFSAWRHAGSLKKGERGSGRGIGGNGAHWEPVGDKNGGGGGEVYGAPTAHLSPRREGGATISR